tara:strand:+ start:158 stop:1114 length:957 start_codon:yes stop_codon:yes gene_type:complete
VESLFSDALNALLNGDKSRSIFLLQQVVKIDTNHISAYLQLGNILREENTDQAIKIHQSLTVRPNLSADQRVQIHKALAKDYIEIGYTKNATEEAKKILLIEKRNLWSLKFLIKTSEENQDWEEAAIWSKHLQKVSGKKEVNDLSRFDIYKGLDCMINGKIEEAKSFFKIAIKKSPDNSQAYKYLGDLYEKNRDLVKALENWQTYATKDKNSGTDVYHKIESALFDLGRYSEVEKFYQELISLDKFNLEATIKLANVLEEKGEVSKALSLVENLSDRNNKDIRIDLMMLKLSIPTATPIELGHQIDAIIDKRSKDSND